MRPSAARAAFPKKTVRDVDVERARGRSCGSTSTCRSRARATAARVARRRAHPGRAADDRVPARARRAARAGLAPGPARRARPGVLDGAGVGAASAELLGIDGAPGARGRRARRSSGSRSSSATGEVLVLENSRFEPGETKNDPALADALARLGDVYVNDAFGAAHRAHATTEGVARRLRPAVAGFLLEREVTVLSLAAGRARAAVRGRPRRRQGERQDRRDRALPRDRRRDPDRRRDVLQLLPRDGAPDRRLAGRGGGRRARAARAGAGRAARAAGSSCRRTSCSPTASTPTPRRDDRRRRRAGRLDGARHRPAHARRPTRTRSRRRARCSGTARWARSSWSRSPAGTRAVAEALARVRRDDGGRRRRLRRGAGAASASPTRSRTSRPAAARRSSCSRASRCPAWRRSMTRADRRPLVAANWKMNKTNAEARGVPATRSCRRPRPSPRTSTSWSARRSPRCARSPTRAAGSRGARRAPRTCTRRTPGAFTGEVSAPMLLELGVEAVVLGHSERRQLLRRDRRGARAQGAAALEAGLLPILCVGETEEEREAGETERKLRQQVQTDLAAVAVDAPARGRDRLRADLGDRHRQDRDAGAGAGGDRASCARWWATATPPPRSDVRILYGGSVNAGNAAELLAQPDVDGALVGGASLDPDEFAAIVGGRARRDERAGPAAPVRRARGARRLGPRPGRPRQRGLARRHAGVRRALGARTRTRSWTPPGEPVGLPRGPDGQLGGRPPEPRRRHGREAGPGPHRRGDRRRQLLRERGAARGVRGGARARRQRCT